ncbi:hypothetical protein K505DRAFT_403835 [Melanomma pulvis-pyrius CBS 109.77]|uniref:Uncharacterized protein n=1 Tax=Melanomma pulvis-pyrius CBS 109.77 TaxID=1314802 RepID=A0A6A6XWT3_9PLEO|nr:hypothetical protein K505DRAFT_403835 [Melanomma pulvis-pyrius CBS 109.77]
MHLPPPLLPLLLLAPFALAAPTPAPAGALATVGKIRGVSTPIYHLYLQANAKNTSIPVLGPEASAEDFTIGATIQSKQTARFLNIVAASTSYKPLVFEAAGTTTAWGLEGDTIITTTGSSFGRQLNFLACKSADSTYYDLYLQTGSDTPSGKTCSNYQTIHLPCLC